MFLRLFSFDLFCGYYISGLGTSTRSSTVLRNSLIRVGNTYECSGVIIPGTSSTRAQNSFVVVRMCGSLPDPSKWQCTHCCSDGVHKVH